MSKTEASFLSFNVDIVLWDCHLCWCEQNIFPVVSAVAGLIGLRNMFTWDKWQLEIFFLYYNIGNKLFCKIWLGIGMFATSQCYQNPTIMDLGFLQVDKRAILKWYGKNWSNRTFTGASCPIKNNTGLGVGFPLIMWQI